MERRQFLASASAAIPLALAGCMGGQDDDPSETTTEPTETTTDSTTSGTTTGSGPLALGDEASLSDDRALGVVDAGATAFVVTRDGGTGQVHANEGERYVTVKFSPSGIDDYESFVADNVTLTVNDEEEFADPVFPVGGGPSRFDAAYSIPTDLTPYTTTVALEAGDETVEWEFDARDIEAITQTVDYSVGSLSAPDAVAAGDSFTAELPVENEGDEVTFRAVLEDTANAPTRASEDLPAGEETTIEVEPTAPEPSDEESDSQDSFEVTLDYGHGEATTTVDYE